MNMVMMEQVVLEDDGQIQVCAQIEDVLEIVTGFTGNFQLVQFDDLAGE